MRCQAAGEIDKVLLEIARFVGEGRQRGEQAGIGAFGCIGDYSGEDVLLVAELVVDGLAGNAGFGGDEVDAAAGEAFAGKDGAGRFDDAIALRDGAAVWDCRNTSGQNCHEGKIGRLDELDKTV